MVRIVWTEISITDLQEIFDYIAEDSLRYATITVNKIYQRIQPISDNPLIGKIVPEIENVNVRELTEGSYRIIYRLKSDVQVDILRVYHSARLLKKTSLGKS